MSDNVTLSNGFGLWGGGLFSASSVIHIGPRVDFLQNFAAADELGSKGQGGVCAEKWDVESGE